MVEVPAAALTIELFEADFFSIGSNDLTQYVTAAAATQRRARRVCSDPLHPAVLRLIARRRRAWRGARHRGQPVRRHGQRPALRPGAARLPACASLSVAPAALARVKRTIARLSADDAVAEQARDEADGRRGAGRRLQARSCKRSAGQPAVRHAPAAGGRAGQEPQLHLPDHQSRLPVADSGRSISTRSSRSATFSPAERRPSSQPMPRRIRAGSARLAEAPRERAHGAAPAGSRQPEATRSSTSCCRSSRSA